MKFCEMFEDKYLKPIKRYDNVLYGWENIKIDDCGERLVPIKNIHSKIIVKPQYFLNGVDGAVETLFLREGIIKKIEEIAVKLPENYKLLIWDAYRPLQVQKSLFEHYYAKFQAETGLSGDELLTYTKKFVSFPSYKKECPAPHNTGAAVDLTVCDENNNPINLGSCFDDFEDKAYTRYYEELLENGTALTEEQQEILYNRRILCNLFEEAGFINYPYEIWHKSYRDQMWCSLNGCSTSAYGSAEIELSDNLNFKKEIIEYESYDNNELYIKKIGNVPVIFTAVHTMEQIKQDGTLKFSEPFTKAVALYISNHIDTSYYVKMRDTGIDSNSKIEDEFKRELLEIIRKHDIKLLIDLHGARAERPFDVELGTLNHLTADFSTIKELEDAFKENGVPNVAFNDPFKGGGITQYIYQNTDIDIVQIEINQKFRDFNNIDNIEKICNSLIAFVKMYSNFN